MSLPGGPLAKGSIYMPVLSAFSAIDPLGLPSTLNL